jgi:hypothetical protein
MTLQSWAAATQRASAQDNLVAVIGPARSKPLQRDRHWDKEDRYLTRVLLPALIRKGSRFVFTEAAASIGQKIGILDN